jgi:hypothetical protein
MRGATFAASPSRASCPSVVSPGVQENGSVRCDEPSEGEEMRDHAAMQKSRIVTWGFRVETVHGAVSRRPPIKIDMIVARTPREFGICPSFKSNFSVAPVPNLRVTIRSFCIAVHQPTWCAEAAGGAGDGCSSGPPPPPPPPPPSMDVPSEMRRSGADSPRLLMPSRSVSVSDCVFSRVLSFVSSMLCSACVVWHAPSPAALSRSTSDSAWDEKKTRDVG